MMKIELSIFLKKENQFGYILRAIIALNWYKSKRDDFA
jgi:hypothetical protein